MSAARDGDAAAIAAAHDRLARHRALLANPERVIAPGAFWDVVALTSSSASQTRAFRARLDHLHARGALPGARERYVVITDPPGARIGSGGATIAVARELKSWFGDAWRDKRVFALHTGGYSERAPQHGTLGKAFAEVPMDCRGCGTPGTILEAQLVQLTPLAATLPPGVFVSCADVALEYGDVEKSLDEETRSAMKRGITALAHPSSVAIGEQHGVFACDEAEVKERVRAMRAGRKLAPLDCRRCLQKPTEQEMRGAGCVMRGYETEIDDWVLTDSCFHIGVEAVEALVELDERRRDVLAGCEICAYGDFMQPLGSDADTSYLDRIDHLASVTSSTHAESETRLRDARRAVADALRGRPLIVIPLFPSRFIHLGTIPEFLYHTTKDVQCLKSLPAPGIPVHMASYVADDFHQPADSVVMSSRIGIASSVGSGSCLVNCDIGRDVVIGANCAMYDVRLEDGTKVENGTFMCTLPITRERFSKRHRESGDDEIDDFSSSMSDCTSADDAVEFVTIVMATDDEVKSRTSSTLCGVPVRDAIDRLELDSGSVWMEGESSTTTLGRFYSVHQSAEESSRAALRMAHVVRSSENAAEYGRFERDHQQQVSISEVLRRYANHGALETHRHSLLRMVLSSTLRRMLETGLPASEWRHRAFNLTSLENELEMERGTVPFEAKTMHLISELLGETEAERLDVRSLRHRLDCSRVALSLALPGALDDARANLARILTESSTVSACGMLARSNMPVCSVRVAYPARFNLAGGWTDTPPYSLERPGAVLHVPGLVNGTKPIVAKLTRIDDPVVRLVMRDDVSGEEIREDVLHYGDLLPNRYSDPMTPFALHKAVLVQFWFREIIEISLEFGCNFIEPALHGKRLIAIDKPGVEIRTEVNLPKGSGLGTSSILAFAMLHAMYDFTYGTRLRPRFEEEDRIELTADVQWTDENGKVLDVEDDHRASPKEALKLSDIVNCVLVVEQMITTGGGWQDQVGGALNGLRLSLSKPSDRSFSPDYDYFPKYTYRLCEMDAPCARLLNSRFACVFTGTCRLAKTVCDSVVTTWQRRDVGVERALQQCADLATQMFEVFQAISKSSRESAATPNGSDCREEYLISRLGALLEEHKRVQQSLWSSIESPTIRAIYDALEPLSYGSFICGAGSGGHVIAFLKPSATRERVHDAVRACTGAPDARVVDVELIL